MKKSIYAVSDIHGHCTELKKALDEAGFRINDEGCLLIVCGDYFDRGVENREVFDFLHSVSNKILIRGNHEDMLEQLLEKKHMGSAGFSNGLDKTLRSFFGDRVIGDLDFSYHLAYRLHFDGREDTVMSLRNLINDTFDYFETENYIFTHGWLPIDFSVYGNCIVKEDFRYETPDVWKRARFTEWYQTYDAGAILEDKTIVCGHRSARFACLVDPARDPMDASIFRAKGVAAIDTSTTQSKKVNVLVIENEECDMQTHEMSLQMDPFMKIKNGKKRVELRLADEKRKTIRVGDRIVFHHKENGETIEKCVVGLHAYRNFDAVLSDFSRTDIGFDDKLGSPCSIMRAYYSDEEVEKYGVLAIRLADQP